MSNTEISSPETSGSFNASLSFAVTDMPIPRNDKMNLLSFLFLASVVAKSSQLACQEHLRRPGTVSLLQPVLMCYAGPGKAFMFSSIVYVKLIISFWPEDL